MAGMTLEELQNQLSGLSSYTPESEDAIRQRITSMFDELSSINTPYVPESNESITQRINDLSSQLTSLRNSYRAESIDSVRRRVSGIYDPQYQQDLQSLRDSVQLGLNQQQRKAVTTGMQRSSYNSANLAGIRGQGLKAEAALGAQRDTNIATMMNQIIEADKNRQLQFDQFRDSLQMQMNQLQAQLIEAEKDRGINANQYRESMQMKLNELLSSIIEADKNRKQNADQNRDNLLLQLYQLANKGSGKGAATPTTSDKSNFMNWFRNASDFEKELYQMSFANDAQKLAAAGAARDAARARVGYQNNAAGEYRDEGSTIPSGLSKASVSDTSWLRLPKATVGIK